MRVQLDNDNLRTRVYLATAVRHMIVDVASSYILASTSACEAVLSSENNCPDLKREPENSAERFGFIPLCAEDRCCYSNERSFLTPRYGVARARFSIVY